MGAGILSREGSVDRMPDYTFDHVGLLAGNGGLARKCEWFYRALLGMQSMVPFGETPEEDFCMLSDGAAPEHACLEIIGQVFEERERGFHALHGPGLDHLSFDTEDVDRAYESLSAAGVAIPIPPYSFLHTRLMCCKDPAGNDVKITQGEPRMKSGPGEAGSHAVNARLDHVGILVNSSEEARIMERFYTQNFGMRAVLRSAPGQERMDWVYLKDTSGTNSIFLQIIDGAFFDHERAFLDAHGAGLDHLCFHVEDADATRQVLQARGVKIEYEGMKPGSQRMFIARDPAGLMVQFIQASVEIV